MGEELSQYNALNEALHSAFFAFIDERQISQAQVARVIGVSSGTISQYRAKKYAGNLKNLETKIDAYLIREKSRGDSIDVPLLDLSSTKQIKTALAMAHAHHEIGVVVGDAGTGKTIALSQYADSTQSAVMIEVDPSLTPHALVMATARAVGVNASGTASVVSQLITEKLEFSDTMIIYDEADYLPASSLEWIRRIVHDKAGCAVVLAGLPRLEHLIRSVRGDHDQLLSRIGIFLSVGRAGKSDIRKIVKSVWADVDKDVVNAICDSARGSVRRTAKLIRIADKIAKQNNEHTPSIDSVMDAVSYVMPERVRRFAIEEVA